MFRAKKIKSDSEKCSKSKNFNAKKWQSPKTLTQKNGRVQKKIKIVGNHFSVHSMMFQAKKKKKSDSEKTLTQKNGRVQKH